MTFPLCPTCRAILAATAVFTEDGTILTRMFCDCGYTTPTVSHGTHELHPGLNSPAGPLWQSGVKVPPADSPYWGAS